MGSYSPAGLTGGTTVAVIVDNNPVIPVQYTALRESIATVLSSVIPRAATNQAERECAAAAALI